MTLNDYISLGIGFLAPLLVSALRGKRWPDWQLMLLIFGLAAGLSSLSLFLTNSFTTSNLQDAIALVVATMFPTYTLLWEKTGLNTTLKKWAPFSKKSVKRKPRKASHGAGVSVNAGPTTDKPNIAPSAQNIPATDDGHTIEV